MYDVGAVRAAFPSLQLGVAHFDAPGGSQTPVAVARAVADAMTSGMSQRGTLSATERRTDEVTLRARAAIADLLAAEPGGVVFGRSMTQLTFDLARTLSQQWGPGDEVVVSRLDHDADIRPWVVAAERAGATVRWLGFDRDTTELDDVGPLLSDRTRLVAVTAASNLFGTRPDVAAVAAAAHAAGALVFVDGVHLAPHAPLDLTQLGADFLVCSPYKFYGPHLGALAADPALLESLRPDKLLPASDAVPERFELGTLPYELLAGVDAAVDFIAGLASAAPDRRTRLSESLKAVEEHESALLEQLLGGLAAIDGVLVHGRPARRTPTVLFSLDGHPGRAVHEHLAGLGVNAPAGSFYAIEASRWAGLGDDGAVRAGISAYTSVDDVERLLAGVAGLESLGGDTRMRRE
ncbi:MAG: cysteine desulfurase-like protein [Nocardioides sp.]